MEQLYISHDRGGITILSKENKIEKVKLSAFFIDQCGGRYVSPRDPRYTVAHIKSAVDAISRSPLLSEYAKTFLIDHILKILHTAERADLTAVVLDWIKEHDQIKQNYKRL